jgi:hypothetical protein
MLTFSHYHFLTATAALMRCHLSEMFGATRIAIDAALRILSNAARFTGAAPKSTRSESSSGKRIDAEQWHDSPGARWREQLAAGL